MNNLEELFIANAELAAELLQHMADNEIDSDYFAVVTDSPNCGREVQSEHSVTEVALMAAGIIEQLIAQLEAAQKERDALHDKFNEISTQKQFWVKCAKELESQLETAEAALSAANKKLNAEPVLVCRINASELQRLIKNDSYAIVDAPERNPTDMGLFTGTQQKPIVLPEAYAVRAGHPINEGERNVMIPKQGGNWLSRFDVEHAIRAAGGKVEGD